MQFSKKILDSIENGIIILDDELKIHFWNKWLTSKTLILDKDVKNKKIDELFPEIKSTILKRKIKTSLRLNAPTFYSSSTGYLIKIKRKKIFNQIFDYMKQDISITPYNIEDRLVTIFIYDQSSIEESNYKLKNSIKEKNRLNNKLKRYVDVIDKNVITLTTDLDGYIKYTSSAFCKLSGYSKDEVINKKPRLFKHELTSSDIYENLWNTIKLGKTWRGELLNKARNGTAYWVSSTITPVFDKQKRLIEYTSVMIDITDKKKIEEISIRDSLTKIYNREKFNQAFKQEVKLAKEYNSNLTLALFDIDFFKKINDNYGHSVGDSVLIEFSKLINENIKVSDTFARWGGEEFALLLAHTEINEAKEVLIKLKDLIENFNFKFIDNITCSIGTTQYLKDDNLESFLKRADTALYQAKNLGRNRLEIG